MKIAAVDLGMSVAGREVLRAETMECAPGEMTALIGASGSGKTTLMHCLGLLQKPSVGQVFVGAEDTSAWGHARVRKFWRDHAAFVIQDYGIVDDETVAANVTMRTSIARNRVQGNQQRWQDALSRCGLAGRDDDPAAQLSGGEKQRLAIARAIYKDAAVIYADEPTASLDVGNRHRVIELFAERAAAGCVVVAATHDEEFIRACSARHVVGASRTLLAATEVGS